LQSSQIEQRDVGIADAIPFFATTVVQTPCAELLHGGWANENGDCDATVENYGRGIWPPHFWRQLNLLNIERFAWTICAVDQGAPEAGTRCPDIV
jgi:hypothetical protein